MLRAMTNDATTAGWHAAGLWILLGLFCFRVAAQLLVSVVPLPLLPAFDSWHSGVLPYPVLVAGQAVVLVVYVTIAMRVATGRARPSRRLSWLFLLFGGAYFAFMAARLVLGLTWLRDSSWFHAPLPTVFHLVLASFLLLAGHFHFTRSQEERSG